MKLTIKQERFCQKYVELGNASEAYRQSYDAENMTNEVINVKASELLKNGKVAVRVSELQAKHAKRHDVTIDSLTRELEEIRNAAFIDKEYSPACSAVMGKAKLHGLIVDKLAGSKGEPVNMNITLSTEEARRIKQALYETF